MKQVKVPTYVCLFIYLFVIVNNLRFSVFHFSMYFNYFFVFSEIIQSEAINNYSEKNRHKIHYQNILCNCKYAFSF